MKRILIALSLIAALAANAASPTFVTKAMMDRRNGLTDAQYEYLWSIGKSLPLNQRAARDLIFRAGRYQNVTNWLDICGKTNNFAALSYDLQGKNFVLDATNKVLVATNQVLEAQCVKMADVIYDQYVSLTNQMAQTSTYSNLYVIVSAQAEAATAKIRDEIADLEAKIVKYKEYQTKYPLLKAIFAAMITDAENRIEILQAFTGRK